MSSSGTRFLVARTWLPTSSLVNRMHARPKPTVAGQCGPLGFYWPFGIAFVDGWFWVADTGNRRVLGWDGVPSPDHLPDVVLGQPDGWRA